MKFLAGILFIFGAGLLIFQSKLVNFVPDIESIGKIESKDLKLKQTSIIFAGDVMLGRAVENRYKEGDIFKNVSSVFKGATAVVANLEGPILNNHIKTPSNSFKFSFATTTLDILKSAGFTDLSLANNHTDNYGRDGFVETILNLEGAKLNPFGDPNIISEYSFIERQIGDNKFIFAGINDTYGNLSKKNIFELGNEIRTKFPDHFLVFVIHWGEEYKFEANSRQEEIGRGLIDAGASLVIGSHPHVIQNVEKYNNKYIFYSLGNFVFDQYFSTSTQEGLVIKLNLQSVVCRFELMPVNSIKSTPYFLTSTERDRWLLEYSGRNESIKSEIVAGCLN